MLGFLTTAVVNAVLASDISTIVSYQSGALHIDIQPVKDYVDAKVDGFLSRKR